MKVLEVTVKKEYKFGLPNYSNITASCGMKVEIGKNEKVDWDSLWDEINQQLYIQSNDIDSSWIKTKEFKNFFRTEVRTKKGGEK